MQMIEVALKSMCCPRGEVLKKKLLVTLPGNNAQDSCPGCHDYQVMEHKAMLPGNISSPFLPQSNMVPWTNVLCTSRKDHTVLSVCLIF